MKISLRISGLILILAGIIFLVSAAIGKSVFWFIVGIVCIICGILWILPRKMALNFHRNTKTRENKPRNGAGRYSR